MGHFDYLLGDSKTRQSRVAVDRLDILAKTAAKRYIEERAPLTDTIRKIASENDLNSEQIKRVCELANLATHQVLWSKTAQKESIAFPLADSRQVVNAVSSDPMSAGEPNESSKDIMTSPCSAGSDYMGPPKGIPAPGPSMMSMMGADPSQVHHGLSEEPEKKSIIIVLQKKAEERKGLASEILFKGMELESLEKSAFAQVKQAVLGGASFYQVYEAAVGAGMGKAAEEYLPGWQTEIVKQSHGTQRLRLEKLAISKAPSDLISENLGNATVINGAHPVLISLDTVVRKTDEVKQGLHNLLRIDDEVKVLNQRLREL
jgi:hypothetical protein